MSIARLCNKNGMWKGDNAKLNAIHIWVKSRKPKPELCERCKLVKPFDLANKSGKYRRDVNDYDWLCRKCHMKKDGRMFKRDKYGRFKKG
jgi:hypothetical protein